MVEPIFDSSYGTGLEGLGNYVGVLTNGFFATTFITSIWIVMVYVLSKSEWDIPGVVAFATFVSMLLSWLFKLFMPVSDMFIFIQAVILGCSVVWAIIANKR